MKAPRSYASTWVPDTKTHKTKLRLGEPKFRDDEDFLFAQGHLMIRITQ
jgi:hypothetical protein